MENDKVNVMYSARPGEPMSSGVVVVAISRAGGANTVALSATVKETLKEIADEIPGSVGVDILYDKAATIMESINDALNDVMEEMEIDIPARPVTELEKVNRNHWLYDSRRTYFDQLKYYKRFQRNKSNE